MTITDNLIVANDCTSSQIIAYNMTTEITDNY